MSDSQRVTSREQVVRIERDYYKRAGPLRSARRWLVALGIVAAAAWCAWGFADRARHHSPGRVAVVHARWEQNCEACHVPLATVRSVVSLDPVVLPRLTPGEVRMAEDSRCEACHRAAAHHPSQIAAEVGSCGSCHVDHQGRDALLTRVSDGTCTACHGNIAAHREASVNATTPPITASITRFDGDHHPTFASLERDPGRLKFSHGRHMLPGLVFGDVAAGGAAKTALRYGMLPAAERSRYQPAGVSDEGLVQLSCASCHEFGDRPPQPDAEAIRALVSGSAWGDGGGFPIDSRVQSRPVSFERHCAACHALPFEGVGSGDPIDASRPREVADQVMPHGLDAAGMRRFLETTMLSRFAELGQSALDRPLPPRPLPSRPREATDPTLRTAVHDAVEKAIFFSRGTCTKCHEITEQSLPPSPLFADARDEDERWFSVPPTGVPRIWFQKARFDHSAHRSFDCRLCHDAAFPDPSDAPPQSALDNQLVMIAGRDSCTACHAPSAVDREGKLVGGVRFDCVECHGYHGLGSHTAVRDREGAY